jgi:hypothetical protein
MTFEKELPPTPAPKPPVTHLFAVDKPPMPVLVKPEALILIPVDKSTVQKIVERVKEL